MDKPLLTNISSTDSALFNNLLEAVGWHFSPSQVASVLSFGTKYGHRIGQRLVSSAAVYAYGPGFASIGVVTVDPAFQRRGLGRALVEQCLRADANSEAVVSLVATAAGYPLYQSLDFETVEYVHRMEYTGTGAGSTATAHDRVVPFQPADLPGVIAFDQGVVGGNRSHMYQAMLAESTQGCVVRNRTGNIAGWGMAVERTGRINVGPLLADDADIALEILQLLIHEPGRRIRIDVPGRQADFRQALSKLGFVEVLTSPLMSWRGRMLPGERDRLYGIADPAFG